MKIHRKSNETQVIGRCERVMIRHDIVGVRKEKVILIVTGPFPFGLITRYTQEMSAFGLHHHRPHMGGHLLTCLRAVWIMMSLAWPSCCLRVVTGELNRRAYNARDIRVHLKCTDRYASPDTYGLR